MKLWNSILILTLTAIPVFARGKSLTELVRTGLGLKLVDEESRKENKIIVVSAAAAAKAKPVIGTVMAGDEDWEGSPCSFLAQPDMTAAQGILVSSSTNPYCLQNTFADAWWASIHLNSDGSLL